MYSEFPFMQMQGRLSVCGSERDFIKECFKILI